jgi:hypothetical protein
VLRAWKARLLCIIGRLERGAKRVSFLDGLVHDAGHDVGGGGLVGLLEDGLAGEERTEQAIVELDPGLRAGAMLRSSRGRAQL